jgi:hypothetical protein
MSKYLLTRTVGEIFEEDIKNAIAREEKLAEQMPNVRWIRSYYSEEEGKLYCEYEAPSIEEIYEFKRRTGIPIDHATMVQMLDPSMFH